MFGLLQLVLWFGPFWNFEGIVVITKLLLLVNGCLSGHFFQNRKKTSTSRKRYEWEVLKYGLLISSRGLQMWQKSFYKDNAILRHLVWNNYHAGLIANYLHVAWRRSKIKQHLLTCTCRLASKTNSRNLLNKTVLGDELWLCFHLVTFSFMCCTCIWTEFVFRNMEMMDFLVGYIRLPLTRIFVWKIKVRSLHFVYRHHDLIGC